MDKKMTVILYQNYSHFWRRRWDLNPRNALTSYEISSHASSTTWVLLHAYSVGWRAVTLGIIAHPETKFNTFLKKFSGFFRFCQKGSVLFVQEAINYCLSALRLVRPKPSPAGKGDRLRWMRRTGNWFLGFFEINLLTSSSVFATHPRLLRKSTFPAGEGFSQHRQAKMIVYGCLIYKGSLV